MSGPIQLTYALPSAAPVTETFDLLIVACDPRALPLAARTALERRVLTSLESFTFRTTLYRAVRPAARDADPRYAVRYNPAVLANMDGRLYGFRDEVMARDPAYRPSPNNVTWATTYQLDARPLIGRDPSEAAADFDRKRDRQLADPDAKWIDFEPHTASNPQPEEKRIVDYFPHFPAADLHAALPWRVRDAQGLNNTLYVSSFTCFESVLHIYLYLESLMRPGGPVRSRFPKDKNARIAVCGAGPSGILFASQHLVKNGYTNFTIFEASARFGGKTMTVHRPAPADPARDVPCELGTCYLSLAYEPMWHLFEEYDAGQVVALDKDTNQFRSVVDEHVAETEEERENGVEYGAWTLRKNGPWQFWERVEMIVAGIRYLIVHYAIMGMTMNDCMPVEPPTELTVLENLQRLVALAKGRSDRATDDEVPANDLYSVLKDEKRDEDDSPFSPRGLFDMLDDLTDDIGDISDMVSVDGLKNACRNVFNTTFGKFLDDNNMDELKSVFTYGYQVQGYGTIDLIPAYYGMIWMTPAVLTGSIRQLFNPSEAASKRGTVNIVTEGWLTLWEKIVERDLKGKIKFNANITAIDRVMDE